MVISVTNTYITPAGFDMFTLFDDMANGLYSMDGATTELVTFTHGLQTLSFHGTFTDSTGSVTGISLKVGASTQLFSMSGAGTELFSTSSMGTEYAPLPAEFAAAYLSDMKITFTGSANADTGWGTNNHDTLLGKGGADSLFGWGGVDVIKGGGGHDMAAGGKGNDTLKGGTGRDLLMGGKHDDKLRGDNGHDLLIAGSGHDDMRGGNGNDVLVIDDGTASVHGDIGRDLFIFDSFASTGSASPTVLRSHVRDYDPAMDVLIFAKVDAFTSGNPGDFSNLGQVANGTIDGFSWNENAKGTVIRSGDARVVVHGVTADQIDLDYILFTTRNAIGTAEVFDPANGGGVLASGLNGAATLAMNGALSTISTSDGASWDLFSGDVTGFMSSGSGNPTV